MTTATASKARAMAPVKKKASPPSHPPFFEMISDAVLTLKERTGSSQYAIQKFIEEKHKQLPSTFRRLLLVQLKRLVASGKLVKVKNSYKLSLTAKHAAATATKKPAAAELKQKASTKKLKPKAEAATKPKPKSAAGKRKAEEKPKMKAGAAAAKPAKVAKIAAKASPGKKAMKPKKVVVKKPKSVKSPARKAKK